MQNFIVNIPNSPDIARCLQLSLGTMNTLSAGLGEWGDLLQALGVTPWHPQKIFHANVTRDAAVAILKRAVPKVSPQDQRAEFHLVRKGEIAFVNPRGVYVLIVAHGERGISLSVDFGRDSMNLAALLLANLLPFTQDAAPLLLSVAEQVVAKQRK